MIIGRIVKSNSHVDYVCHIFGEGEIPDTPRPRDHALGRFVRIPIAGEDSNVVGVIYDTLLVNPEFGNLGPRLSPESELEVFSPDYLNEKAVLVGIMALGHSYPTAQGPGHEMPTMAPTVGAEVHVLTDQETAAFHRVGGRLRVGYLPRLAATRNPMVTEVLVRILSRLHQEFPAEARALDVLRKTLLWKSRVEEAS